MCFKFRERLTYSNNHIIMNGNDNMWITSNYMWTDVLYKGALNGHICVNFVQPYYLVIYVFIYHVIWVFLPKINFTYLLIQLNIS